MSGRTGWVLLLVAACAAPAPATTPPTPVPTAERYTITGTFKLIDSNLGKVGSACYGRRGYDDISSGADVVVRDQAGVIIAGSALDGGVLDGPVTCVFPFTVRDVPRATFYAVEVSHRGELTYSFDEMVQRSWKLGFVLD